MTIFVVYFFVILGFFYITRVIYSIIQYQVLYKRFQTLCKEHKKLIQKAQEHHSMGNSITAFELLKFSGLVLKEIDELTDKLT